MFLHTAKKCTSKSYCRFCSEEHASESCTNKNKLKCINCIQANNKYNTHRQVDHAASDFKNCETYKYFLQRQIKKIDYPFNPLVNAK